jgi:predicted nucleic acid-binding protein
MEIVFLDSDVVISSLISKIGAAYYLLTHIENINLHISNISKSEIETVIERLSLPNEVFYSILNNNLKVTAIDLMKIESVTQYVIDQGDAHIILGTRESHARFLVSYNLKHYKTDKIKRDLGIIVISPGQFLQYLKSISVI